MEANQHHHEDGNDVDAEVINPNGQPDDADAPPSDDDDDSMISSSSSSSTGSSSSSSMTDTETAQQTLEMLANNDPELTSLDINHAVSDGIIPNWRKIGDDIAKNTHVELVAFHHMDSEDVTRERFETIFEGMARNIRISDVDFLQTDLLNGTVFMALSPVFERIRQLTIEDCELGPDGGKLLAQALDARSSKSALEEVNFDRIGTDHVGVTQVIRALASHSNLQKISLRGDGVETAGCIELANLLRNHDRLITLDLGENGIGDKGANLLAKGLKHDNCTVAHLNLDSNSIDARGWRALSMALGPCCGNCTKLKSLSLNDSIIHDDEVCGLAFNLVHNTVLMDLYLDNIDITFGGIEALAELLQSQKSVLKHLSLRHNAIRNKGANALAKSLVNNTTLKRLDLENDTSITSSGWAAFSRLLCRKSSIMDTYHSNHALEKLVDDEWTLSGEVMTFLLLNREGNRNQVARQKIIKCHFSRGKMDMQPFILMKLEALPLVIAWMSRDGISLLYQFVRNMQSFFNISNDGVMDSEDDDPRPKRQKVQMQSDLDSPTTYTGDWWK